MYKVIIKVGYRDKEFTFGRFAEAAIFIQYVLDHESGDEEISVSVTKEATCAEES